MGDSLKAETERYERAAAIEKQRALMEQEMLQAGKGGNPTPLASYFPTPRGLLSDKGAQHIVSMTFVSSSGGVPHIVTKQGDYIRCTCEAMKSIETRPTGCWAMVDFRRVAGIQAP